MCVILFKATCFTFCELLSMSCEKLLFSFQSLTHLNGTFLPKLLNYTLECKSCGIRLDMPECLRENCDNCLCYGQLNRPWRQYEDLIQTIQHFTKKESVQLGTFFCNAYLASSQGFYEVKAFELVLECCTRFIQFFCRTLQESFSRQYPTAP